MRVRTCAAKGSEAGGRLFKKTRSLLLRAVKKVILLRARRGMQREV